MTLWRSMRRAALVVAPLATAGCGNGPVYQENFESYQTGATPFGPSPGAPAQDETRSFGMEVVRDAAGSDLALQLYGDTPTTTGLWAEPAPGALGSAYDIVLTLHVVRMNQNPVYIRLRSSPAESGVLTELELADGLVQAIDGYEPAVDGPLTKVLADVRYDVGETLLVGMDVDADNARYDLEVRNLDTNAQDGAQDYAFVNAAPAMNPRRPYLQVAIAPPPPVRAGEMHVDNVIVTEE